MIFATTTTTCDSTPTTYSCSNSTSSSTKASACNPFTTIWNSKVINLDKLIVTTNAPITAKSRMKRSFMCPMCKSFTNPRLHKSSLCSCFKSGNFVSGIEPFAVEDKNTHTPNTENV